MTSSLTLARERDRRIISAFGGGQRATLRRFNTLRASGTQVTVMSANAASSGATSLVATKPRLDGRAIMGAQFTVAGITGIYTLTSDCDAVTGQITLAFAPALSGAVAADVAITFTVTSTEHTYLWMQGTGQEQEDVSQGPAGKRIHVLAYEKDKPHPRQGDQIKPPGETRYYNVGRVRVIGAAGVTRWRCETDTLN